MPYSIVNKTDPYLNIFVSIYRKGVSTSRSCNYLFVREENF